MKERKFLRSIALLAAIVLTVTTTFSNYNFVKAAENDITASTQQSGKELVQCDGENGKDGWLIFKHTDVYGEPTFDVKYQGKSVKEIKHEGDTIEYQLIRQSPDCIYECGWYPLSIDGVIDLNNFPGPGPNNALFVRFIFIHLGNRINSDVIALYPDNDFCPYILSTNYSYLDTYYLDRNLPNNFRVEVKLNEHLKQTGDLSISKRMTYISDDIGMVNVSNLTFKNCNKINIIEDKEYETKYSIISFDLELPSKYFYDISEEYMDSAFRVFIFSFDGLVGMDSNNKIEDLIFDVEIPAFPNMQVQSITITGPTSNITVGNSVNLTANILPSDFSDIALTWSSSNSEYATVDENGIVTAKAAGAGKTVTITAKATDGSGVEGNFTLNIGNIPTTSVTPTIPDQSEDILVQSIKISAPSAQVKAGKTINLNASVNSDATNKSIVWSSSNTKYATVNSNGIVTAKAAGAGKTVTITAKATDGSGKIATFKLKISKVAVKKIKLKAKKSVKVGKKLKIKLTINSDATNKAVKWSVSNKKYAKINSKGVLTAKKAGKGKTVKVTAKAKDGSGKKATIKIKIKK